MEIFLVFIKVTWHLTRNMLKHSVSFNFMAIFNLVFNISFEDYSIVIHHEKYALLSNI